MHCCIAYFIQFPLGMLSNLVFVCYLSGNFPKRKWHLSILDMRKKTFEILPLLIMPPISPVLRTEIDQVLEFREEKKINMTENFTQFYTNTDNL